MNTASPFPPPPAALRRLVSDGLRALVGTAPWAAQRLLPFAGSLVVLEVGQLVIPLVIDPEGYPALAPNRPERADLTIRIPAEVVPGLLLRQESALREMHLEGNSGLAHEIGFLARHFRPDLEELLSRVVGDAAAHRIGRMLEEGQRWLQDSVRRMTASGTEYLTEEARVAVSRAEWLAFAEDLQQLQARLNALELRMQRLP